jgi:hypothetical protein
VRAVLAGVGQVFFIKLPNNRRKNMSIDLYDPNLSESEIQGKLAMDVAQRWKSETKEGREFEKFFASRPENIDALVRVFDLLDENLSFETLSAAYRTLRENAEILSETEVEQAKREAERHRDEANRAKWQSDCEAYIDSHSTREITERAKTDRAFASWLQKQNVPPVVETMYDSAQLTRQKREQRARREKDKPYLNVPEEVQAFAQSYRCMSFAEVQQKIRDPLFRAQVEQAAKAGLI